MIPGLQTLQLLPEGESLAESPSLDLLPECEINLQNARHELLGFIGFYVKTHSVFSVTLAPLEVKTL